MRMTIFLVSLIFFGCGGVLFSIGILFHNEPLYYIGIVLGSLPLPLVCYLILTSRRNQNISQMEDLPNQYVYRNPGMGMKYNKSDTDLQLTAIAAATADDGSVVLP